MTCSGCRWPHDPCVVEGNFAAASANGVAFASGFGTLRRNGEGSTDTVSEERRQRLSAAMAGMAAGDRAALDTVYEMTSAKLFGVIVRILRARDRAEDVLQETYVKAWQRSARFDAAKGSPVTWLATIARNTAINELRRSGRNPVSPDAAIPEIEDEAKPVDEWLCDVEDAEALHRCLDELKRDQRRSIRLAYFEGLTHSELAERMDVPLGTLKSWIRRGLHGLRGCLGG